MALSINTNFASLNAQRNLTNTRNDLATSLQRLSSGLRINSAKDDAAGLFTAELMTSQIRGLNQSARNASDGISLAQTAEGALSQIGNNVQRIREIAVQSANATTGNRAGLQAEVDQLTQEISRIIETTEFNGTKLLSGGNSLTFQVGADGVSSAQIAITTTDLTTTTGSAGEYAAALNIVSLLNGQTLSGASLIDAEVNGLAIGNPDVTPVTIGTVTPTSANNVFTANNANGAAAIAAYEAAEAVYNAGGGEAGGVTSQQLVAAAQAVADGYNPATAAALNSYTSSLSGTGTIDVSSQSAASAALSNLDSDINQISTTRATFGAVQNRFDAVIANVRTYSENLSAARSRIMDADFAVETAQLTRSQILQQAGVAMLGQANSLPQLALTLLNG